MRFNFSSLPERVDVGIDRMYSARRRLAITTEVLAALFILALAVGVA